MGNTLGNFSEGDVETSPLVLKYDDDVSELIFKDLDAEYKNMCPKKLFYKVLHKPLSFNSKTKEKEIETEFSSTYAWMERHLQNWPKKWSIFLQYKVRDSDPDKMCYIEIDNIFAKHLYTYEFSVTYENIISVIEKESPNKDERKRFISFYIKVFYPEFEFDAEDIKNKLSLAKTSTDKKFEYYMEKNNHPSLKGDLQSNIDENNTKTGKYEKEMSDVFYKIYNLKVSSPMFSIQMDDLNDEIQSIAEEIRILRNNNLNLQKKKNVVDNESDTDKISEDEWISGSLHSLREEVVDLKGNELDLLDPLPEIEDCIVPNVLMSGVDTGLRTILSKPLTDIVFKQEKTDTIVDKEPKKMKEVFPVVKLLGKKKRKRNKAKNIQNIYYMDRRSNEEDCFTKGDKMD
jgi:hypothetical protein